jgi:hypothetical protein
MKSLETLMIRLPSTRAYALAVTLTAASMAACVDDDPPPFGGDGSVGDAAFDGTAPDGGSVDVTCEVDAVVTVGASEAKHRATRPDRVSVIADPSGSGFLLATAEAHCPGPCDGGFDSAWKFRRVMLYPIPAGPGAAPGAPVMVGEGAGPLQKTHAEDPALTIVGDGLVVAWIDDLLGGEPRNVWTRRVSLPGLSPEGAMTRVSSFVSGAARRLVLAGGAAGGIAMFEHLEVASGEAPTLHMAPLSPAGEPGPVAPLGSIPKSADSHAIVRLASDAVVFGRTEPTSGGHCDFLVGPPGDEGVEVQEDPATFACGQVALTEGATAFGATSGGIAVVQFRRLDQGGSPLGSERRIAGARGELALQPGIAPLSGGFFVVYVRAGQGRSLRGALVSSGGEVLDDFELVPSLGEISNPSVAVSVDGSDIAVAWKERVDTHLETRMIRLHCDG